MDGIELIANERRRQQAEEGWTAEHDEQHTGGVLALAAACYAAGRPIFTMSLRAIEGDAKLPVYIFDNAWPFERRWYKPKDDISNLIRAGALIAAEIDRLLAANAVLAEAAGEGV